MQEIYLEGKKHSLIANDQRRNCGDSDCDTVLYRYRSGLDHRNQQSFLGWSHERREDDEPKSQPDAPMAGHPGADAATIPVRAEAERNTRRVAWENLDSGGRSSNVATGSDSLLIGAQTNPLGLRSVLI